MCVNVCGVHVDVCVFDVHVSACVRMCAYVCLLVCVIWSMYICECFLCVVCMLIM